MTDKEVTEYSEVSDVSQSVRTIVILQDEFILACEEKRQAEEAKKIAIRDALTNPAFLRFAFENGALRLDLRRLRQAYNRLDNS